MAKIIRVASDVERSAPDGSVTRRSLDTNAARNISLPRKMQAVVNEAYQSSNIFVDLPKIETKEQLEQLLAQLIIRFDTRPDNYTRKDYQLLIALLRGIMEYSQSIEITSSNPDILTATRDEEGNHLLTPQTGTLSESDENTEGVYQGSDNNESKIVTIGDIRNYINNKLTWIEK